MGPAVAEADTVAVLAAATVIPTATERRRQAVVRMATIRGVPNIPDSMSKEVQPFKYFEAVVVTKNRRTYNNIRRTCEEGDFFLTAIHRSSRCMRPEGSQRE